MQQIFLTESQINGYDNIFIKRGLTVIPDDSVNVRSQ